MEVMSNLSDLLLRSTVDANYQTKNATLSFAELDGNFKLLADVINETLLSVAPGGVAAYDPEEEYSLGRYATSGGNLWEYVNPTPSTGNAPAIESDFWIIQSTGVLSHAQNTDLYTNASRFGVGPDTDGNVELFARIGAVENAEPRIRYNATTDEWEFSNDGAAFTALGSGDFWPLAGTANFTDNVTMAGGQVQVVSLLELGGFYVDAWNGGYDFKAYNADSGFGFKATNYDIDTIEIASIELSTDTALISTVGDTQINAQNLLAYVGGNAIIQSGQYSIFEVSDEGINYALIDSTTEENLVRILIEQDYIDFRVNDSTGDSLARIRVTDEGFTAVGAELIFDAVDSISFRIESISFPDYDCGIFLPVQNGSLNAGVTISASAEAVGGVQDVLILNRYMGGGVNGVGGRIAFAVNNDNPITGGLSPLAGISYILTDVTDGAEDSKYSFEINEAGAVATIVEMLAGGIRINGVGRGLEVQSPDGNYWRLTPSNAGASVWTAI